MLVDDCRSNGEYHQCKLWHLQEFDNKIGQDAIYHCKDCDFKMRKEFVDGSYVPKIWLIKESND